MKLWINMIVMLIYPLKKLITKIETILILKLPMNNGKQENSEELKEIVKRSINVNRNRKKLNEDVT